MTGLNTLERDDLLRKIAWQNARIDKIERMLKGEQVGTARIADAAITNAKIKDLTWDKAQGGTATLGGLNNVGGVLSIKDNANVEKIVLDKDGILINDGKIIIKDSDGSSFIDSSGVVSDVVFPTNDIDGTPFVDFDYGGGLFQLLSTNQIEIELTRTSNALVILSVVSASSQVNNTLDCSGRTEYVVFSSVDGVILYFFYDSFLTVATNVRENIISKTYSSSSIFPLTAGSHGIAIYGRVSSNVNQVSNLNTYNLSVTLLGK